MTLEHGILRITTTETAEVEASRARLHVRVEGETFVFGNAALSRSREVAELVSRLKTLGLTDDDLSLKGVSAKVNQGVLVKGTRVSFSLAATIRALEILPEVLGAITTAKHAELERLEWVFDDEAARLDLVARATKKALEQATVMARAVGHEIAGIRALSDSSAMPEAKNLSFGAGDWTGQERARVSRESRVDLGTEFRATREISAYVTADFVMAKTSS